MKFIRPRDWFFQMWPFEGPRSAVLAGYADIGMRHKPVLTDIALRGGVYRPYDPVNDGTLENFNGRRELALEIIKLARADAGQLFDLVANKPSGERP